jgi:hypothetical protein
MSAPFKVSDKVVCVDASPGMITGRICLAHGQVYVVEGCEPGFPSPHWKVYLVGIDLGLNQAGETIGFAHTRFRLLEEVQAENRARRTQETNV